MSAITTVTTAAAAVEAEAAPTPHTLESLQLLFSMKTECSALILAYLGLYTAESLHDLCHLIALHAEWAKSDPDAVDSFVIKGDKGFAFPLVAGFLRCA